MSNNTIQVCLSGGSCVKFDKQLQVMSPKSALDGAESHELCMWNKKEVIEVPG